MNGIHSIQDGETLRKRIETMPEDIVLFRSDFPEYHPEFVGETLAELTNEGILVKLAQGIYAKTKDEGVTNHMHSHCERARQGNFGER